jgi:hypothetical protein
MQKNKEITFLLGRFPTFRGRILDEYNSNEEFKSLCDDLYSSACTLEDRQKKLSIVASGELEYRKLYLELEEEVVHFLERKRSR